MSERVLDRFMAKVDVQPSGCWIWTGAISAKGYGRFGLNGRNRLAYNVAYEIFVGPKPTDLTLDHLCENRACVNPDHLEAVTNRENLERGRWPHNRFKTHCRHGHPLEPTRDTARRVCRVCARAAQARYKLRRAEKLTL